MPRRQDTPEVLKGRLIACAQPAQPSLQDFEVVCRARNPGAEAMESCGFRGLLSQGPFRTG